MLSLIVVASNLLCAVNVPLLYFGTTKRLGFLLLLCLSIVLVATRAKVTFSRDFFLVASFWMIYMVSVLVGVLQNGELTTLAVTAGSTFLLVFFSGVCSRAAHIDDTTILSSIFCLNVLALLPFILDFHVKGYSVFFLRKYLIESSIPINSIFNQFYVLFCLNVLALIISRGRRLIYLLFLGWTFALFALILFSLSRQNFLACTVFLLFLSGLSLGWKKISILGIGAAVLLVCLFPLAKEFEQASYVVARIERTETQVSGGHSYSRFTQFADSLTLGAESPLLGVGIGGFYKFAEGEGYAEHVRVPEATVNQLASEHGILMLLFFLAIYCVMCLRASGYPFVSRLGECKSKNRWLLSFMAGQFILFFFNEVHFQFSFWGVYLIFIREFSWGKDGIRSN